MKIALIGYGKMGMTIEEIALQKGDEIVLKINEDNLHDFTESNIKKADVAIEFSGPHSAFENIKTCLQCGVAVVSGSTGWLEKLPEIEALVKELNGSFMYSSNYSIGVNIFFELNKKLAQLMGSYDDYNVAIEEIHHTQKKDAPSGTAISLAEQVMQNIPTKKEWINNETDKADELSIISKRIENVPGTHSVKYTSAIDDIEIIHTAHNRKGFAAGALLAAHFISDKKGVFSMREALGIVN